MGTASFSVGRHAAGNGSSGGISMLSTKVVTSGAFTTSTTAANMEDASGDISLRIGHVIQVHASEAMRIAFGGTAATASTGHYIPASGQATFEVREPGTVSIVDVA